MPHPLVTSTRPDLVMVSVLIAVIGAYVALDVAVRATNGRGRPLARAACGGLVMGAGIWSMHFVGMLALSLPVRVSYDPVLVALSALAAVAGSVAAFVVGMRVSASRSSLVLGAGFMGVAITAMHYLGIASMRMRADITWQTPLLVLSIMIAFGASALSLWLVFSSAATAERRFLQRLTAAVTLGAAVSGLHYTGMGAAHFQSATGADAGGVGTSTLVAILVVAGTVLFGMLVAGAAADGRRADFALDLTRLAEVVADIGRGDDARPRICAAVQELSGADVAILFEPDADGTLTATASAGLADRAAVPREATASSSTAAAVFAMGQRRFKPDLMTADQHAEIRGLQSAAWEPVLLDDRPVGVLAVGFEHHVRRLPVNVATLLRLLAAETATSLERTELLARLSRLAATDELTGLPNRRRLDEELARMMAKARRTGEALSLALLDLDHFKAYNDRHGHLAGDRLLKSAAGAWTAAMRDEDMVGRWGGEEFLALMTACPPDQAGETAERLRRSVPGVGCSAGVATWDGTETADELLERCDQRLYAAKRTGRGRTVARS